MRTAKPPYLYMFQEILIKQISYEWEKIQQIRSRAVAVPYFAFTVTINTLWLDETHENNGKPFQCYDMPYSDRAVSQKPL
jgi:hypothetical protein